MYENGNKHRIRIDLPSFNMPNIPKFFKKKEEKNNGNKRTILSVISKFSVVCIFFFIFIFCISRFGKVINVSYGEPEFNTNITYIKEKVLDYYNSNNIPQKNGDSSSLSLEELISYKVVDKTKIYNIDKCNLKESYASLTKTREKIYNLKISLDCDGIIEEKEDIIKNIDYKVI